MNATPEIVTLVDRLDLAPMVAAGFITRGTRDGYSFERTLKYVAASDSPIPKTFALLGPRSVGKRTAQAGEA